MTKSKSKCSKRKYVPCCFQKKKCASLSELLKTGTYKRHIRDLLLKNKCLAKELEASQCKVAEQTKAMQKMGSQQNKILLAQSKVAEIAKLMTDIVSALVEVRGYLDIEFCNDFSTQTKPESLHRKFPSMEAIQEVSMELDLVKTSFKTPSPPTMALKQAPPSHDTLTDSSKVGEKQGRKSSGSKKDKQGYLTPELIIESPILYHKKSNSRRQSSFFRKSGSRISKSSGKDSSPYCSESNSDQVIKSSASKNNKLLSMVNSPEIAVPSDATVFDFGHSGKISGKDISPKESISDSGQLIESSDSKQTESCSMVNSPEIPALSEATVCHFAMPSQIANLKDLTDMELTEVISVNPIVVYDVAKQSNAFSGSENQKTPVASVVKSCLEKSFSVSVLPNSVPCSTSAIVDSRPDPTVPEVPQAKRSSSKVRAKPAKQRKKSRNSLEEDMGAPSVKESKPPSFEPIHDQKISLSDSFSSPHRRSRRKRLPKVVFSPSPITPRPILKEKSKNGGTPKSPSFSVFASPHNTMKLQAKKPRSTVEPNPGTIDKESPAGEPGVDEILSISTTPRVQLNTPESKRVSFAPTDVVYKFQKKSNLKDHSALQKVRRASKSSFIACEDEGDCVSNSESRRITLLREIVKKKAGLSSLKEDELSAQSAPNPAAKIADSKISSLNGPCQKKDLSPTKNCFFDGETELYTLTQPLPLFLEASESCLPGEIQKQLVNPPKYENKPQKLVEHESSNRRINFDEETELYTFSFPANQADCLKENETLPKLLFGPTKLGSNAQKLPEHKSINGKINLVDKSELDSFSFPANHKDCLKENGTSTKQPVNSSKTVSNSQKISEYEGSRKMNLDDETELYTFSFPANMKNGLKENEISESKSGSVHENTSKGKNNLKTMKENVKPSVPVHENTSKGKSNLDGMKQNVKPSVPVHENTSKGKSNLDGMKENVKPADIECKAVKTGSKRSSQCFNSLLGKNYLKDIKIDDLFIPSKENSRSKKFSSSTDCKKSSSSSSTFLSEGQRDSNADTNSVRLSRRSKVVKTYKEPSLNKKMRRE